ncbi:GL25682 [Drosophila persimilis]|uniref:GL25682 n=1 Tax=Drosophila persimilis TaxID=7234 RepID=B4GUD1_DROPE|nr:GL25682 [Drosophila persimilis]
MKSTPSRSSVSISVSSDEHFSRFEEDLGEEEHLSRETSKDDFARLKAERERERMTRQIHHAAMTLELMKGEAPAGTSSGGASEQDNGRQTRKDTEIQTDKSHISKKKDK